MTTEWINKEIVKLIKRKEGSGLDVINISYIRNYLIKRAVKIIRNSCADVRWINVKIVNILEKLLCKILLEKLNK